MKKRIVCAIVLLSVAALFYKHSLRSMASSSSSSVQTGGMITLVSGDNVNFQIPRAIAEQSPMLRGALQSGMRESAIGLIRLQETSADLLRPMVTLLNQMLTTINIDNSVISTLADFDSESLAQIADFSIYLGLDQLTDAIMRLYIFQSLTENRDATAADLKASLDNEHLKSSIDQFFDYVKKSAGFAALGKTINKKGMLELNGLSIENLYGLGLIPGKESIKALSLYNNKLTQLEPGILNGLTSLQKLDLGQNKLTQLEPGVFNGLTSLQKLDLAWNPLTQLQPGVFNGLTNLKELYLEYNQLTQLQPGVFNGLTSLQDLSFTGNELTQLQPGVFDGLTSLQDLSFTGNELTQLQPGVFNGLTSLQKLWLNNNKLTQLQPGVFNGLTSLRELGLWSNPFNPPLTENQVRAMLPNGGQGVTIRM